MTAIPRPLFVAIVDDSPVVVLGVTALLRPFGRRVRVAAYDGSLPRRGRADVVLYDPFTRPNTTRRLGEIARESGAPVLAYVWDPDQEQVADAMRAGAAGFVSKALDGAAVLAAIEAIVVVRTGAPVPRADESTDNTLPGEREGLSTREAAIVALIVVGMSNQDIAFSLYLSEEAVQTHIRSAYAKMGVTSRTQAVAWGIQHRLGLAAPKARLNGGGQP